MSDLTARDKSMMVAGGCLAMAIVSGGFAMYNAYQLYKLDKAEKKAKEEDKAKAVVTAVVAKHMAPSHSSEYQGTRAGFTARF